MNILPSPTKFQPPPKLANTILDSFVVSILALIPTQLAPLPPSSFTPNSITVIFISTTTYLSLRLSASNRFRTLSPVLLLKLLNPVTSLLSYALFTAQNNQTHRIQTPLTYLYKNSSGDQIANVNFTQCARKLPEFAEITQNNGHYAVQRHSKSPILVPIESPYTICY